VSDAERLVAVGRITGVFGVRGWVRVYSYTQPLENILEYGPWLLGGDPQRAFAVVDGQVHGKGIVARLAGIDDRDLARGLIGAEIAVPRSRLGGTSESEFFWSDLIGLEVVNLAGASLGTVSELMETGGNDVLVLSGEKRRLVPFTRRVVQAVDLASRRIDVDWDADF